MEKFTLRQAAIIYATSCTFRNARKKTECFDKIENDMQKIRGSDFYAIQFVLPSYELVWESGKVDFESDEVKSFLKDNYNIIL